VSCNISWRWEEEVLQKLKHERRGKATLDMSQAGASYGRKTTNRKRSLSKMSKHSKREEKFITQESIKVVTGGFLKRTGL